MTINQTFYIPLFVGSVLLFCYSCYQRLQLIALGTGEYRSDRPVQRLTGVLSYAFGQKRVIARPFGLNHLVLFWAFILLLLANAEFLLEGLFPSVSLALLPAPLHQGFTFLFELVSLLALVAVMIAFVRRLLFPPAYLGNEYCSPRSGEALLILALIAVLMSAFFLLHAALICLGTSAGFRPISTLFAGLLAGTPTALLQSTATIAWWVHAVVLLVFMNLLPRSKHMHILTAIPNVYMRSLGKPNTQPRETFVKGARFGVGTVEQFSWKDLLDSLTCTECGRCQDLCPAYRTGKPLNPRRILHDIKANLLRNGAVLKKKGSRVLPLIDAEQGVGSCPVDALWSCTTCGACVSVCPVLIEQMPKIIKMRRHLVQEKAEFPEELLNLFESMEQRSNPWGIAPADRGKWSSLLGDRTFTAGKTEYLFFVGCAGAFDTRVKQVSVAVATIMDWVGLSWGMLGKEELCCGDSLRRLGNEFVFDKIARENVELLIDKGVSKIVTACPHCFSTLKNDYRQYGVELEVLHHSELIEKLIDEGRLKLPKTVSQGNLLFHDSCYLGRHNDIYEAPRKLIKTATGFAPDEFERNRADSFCCGAGGGRMWLEEVLGTRINQDRVKEALQQKPDTLCVSCPYCMTMMEDGLKDLNADGVTVMDVAEVVAETLR